MPLIMPGRVEEALLQHFDSAHECSVPLNQQAAIALCLLKGPIKGSHVHCVSLHFLQSTAFSLSLDSRFS